jgi:hypothetical protein
LKLARTVSEKTGLPIVFLSAITDILDKLSPRKVTLPVLPLDRSLLKPWERRKKASGTE